MAKWKSPLPPIVRIGELGPELVSRFITKAEVGQAEDKKPDLHQIVYFSRLLDKAPISAAVLLSEAP